MADISDINLGMKNTVKEEKKDVYVTGVGYENSDGTGIQTLYKKHEKVTLLKEEKGAKYPFLVEYHGDIKRYFKTIDTK